MVVAARLMFITDRVRDGYAVSLHFTGLMANGSEKIRVVIGSIASPDNVPPRCLSLALQLVADATVNSVVTDRGHRYSNGSSEVSFYFKPISRDGFIAQPTPTRRSTPAEDAISPGLLIPSQEITAAENNSNGVPAICASIATESSNLPGAAEPITSRRFYGETSLSPTANIKHETQPAIPTSTEPLTPIVSIIASTTSRADIDEDVITQFLAHSRQMELEEWPRCVHFSEPTPSTPAPIEPDQPHAGSHTTQYHTIHDAELSDEETYPNEEPEPDAYPKPQQPDANGADRFFDLPQTATPALLGDADAAGTTGAAVQTISETIAELSDDEMSTFSSSEEEDEYIILAAERQTHTRTRIWVDFPHLTRREVDAYHTLICHARRRRLHFETMHSSGIG